MFEDLRSEFCHCSPNPKHKQFCMSLTFAGRDGMGKDHWTFGQAQSRVSYLPLWNAAFSFASYLPKLTNPNLKTKDEVLDLVFKLGQAALSHL